MTNLPELSPQLVTVLVLIALWTIPWKGYALWRAAGRKEKWWFIALLVVNTLGILEILYIYVFSKRSPREANPPHSHLNSRGNE